MTGHAEVIQIRFDPTVISYEELLEVLWHTHDATTLNQQGADVGTQYRSVIFYHTEEQRQIAEQSKTEMDKSVTEITPIDTFYPAEDYHQNYFLLNSRQPYCQFVIHPKMRKFTKDFKEKLKNEQ
ncbi:Peptide methionine sulfoxide reductase MsrA [Geodia barretti]|uniref:peptide-methionine (S)-S-oxide reductase n=1 Tax=Geodia barretti TaxID=519541 RepID=A0AA35RAE6_GEOBA|nr:Peptide methionine sulfoxide reductase MsrA [Geodia barretti]